MPTSTFLTAEKIQKLDNWLRLLDSNPEYEKRYINELFHTEGLLHEWLEVRLQEAIEYLGTILPINEEHTSVIGDILITMFVYGLTCGELRWEGKIGNLDEFRDAVQGLDPDQGLDDDWGPP